MLNIQDSISLIERLRANGWSKKEDELLLLVAKEARENNRPLCKAFIETAMLTGRKPNSVRNRYYALAKEDPALLRKPLNSTVHFTEEEQTELLRNMLIGISNGESVRGCALRLGNGDIKLMLRYQNKFRTTMLKHKEQMLRVAEQLRNEGINVTDLYDKGMFRRRNSVDAPLKLLASMSRDELDDLIAKLVEIKKAQE